MGFGGFSTRQLGSKDSWARKTDKLGWLHRRPFKGKRADKGGWAQARVGTTRWWAQSKPEEKLGRHKASVQRSTKGRQARNTAKSSKRKLETPVTQDAGSTGASFHSTQHKQLWSCQNQINQAKQAKRVFDFLPSGTKSKSEFLTTKVKTRPGITH